MQNGGSSPSSSSDPSEGECTILGNNRLYVYFKDGAPSVKRAVVYKQLSSGTSHIATTLPKHYRVKNQLRAQEGGLVIHSLDPRNEWDSPGKWDAFAHQQPIMHFRIG